MLGNGRGATVFHSGSCSLSTARQVAPLTKDESGTGHSNHGRSCSRQQITLSALPELTSISIHLGMNSGLGNMVKVFWPAQI